MRNLAQILDVLAELIIRWFRQVWKHFAGIHKMWCHCIRLCLKRILRVIFALCTAESGARAPQYPQRVMTSEQDLPVRRAIYTESPVALDAAFKSRCSTPGDLVKAISPCVM